MVGITQPLVRHETENRFLTPEEFIVYCARVSAPENQDKHETGPKLIKYLERNKHWSPFEMVNVVMEVEVTRDISRQLLRHDMHFQEYSLRYAEAELGFEYSEARLQDYKNRQNSIVCNNLELRNWWYDAQYSVTDQSYTKYQEAIDRGIAKEVARKILPEGLTLSRLYVNGTVRNWYHYCQLRMANGTQKEHMDLANACWSNLLQYFPTLKDIHNDK